MHPRLSNLLGGSGSKFGEVFGVVHRAEAKQVLIRQHGDGRVYDLVLDHFSPTYSAAKFRDGIGCSREDVGDRHGNRNPTLIDEPGRDDLLFMTVLPWVSFTSFMHPMHLHPADSVPRFAWGKFFKENKRLKMPLGVQGHHALMDGLHMGRFYAEVQEYLDHPQVP